MAERGVSAAEALPALLLDLSRRGITDIALTGGLAFGAWVAPRYTKDFDLCAIVPQAAVDALPAQ